MSTNFDQHVFDIYNDKLRGIADRVSNLIVLASQKAVLNSFDSGSYPIHKKDELTNLFSMRFKRLNDRVKKNALVNTKNLIKSTKFRRKLKDLAKIKIKSNNSILDEFKKIKIPKNLRFSAAEMINIRKSNDIVPLSLNMFPTTTRRYPRVRQVKQAGISLIESKKLTKKLLLRIIDVKCHDETGRGLEIGKDEIYLSGSAIDPDGTVRKIDYFKVGSFDDGKKKEYNPPKIFSQYDYATNIPMAGSFSLYYLFGESQQWPKTFTAILTMFEDDPGGGIADFTNKLVDILGPFIRDELSALALEGGTILAGPVVGAMIAAAVSYAIGKALTAIKNWWEDEIFVPPLTVNTTLENFYSRWNGSLVSPRHTLYFRDHNGKYSLHYDWIIIP